MAVATTDAVPNSTAMQPRLRLFTVDELEAMVLQGILGERPRVELIEGQIVEMPPMGDGHIWTLSELIDTFSPQPRTRLSVQSTLQLDEQSGPEPDIAVIHANRPKTRKPSPQDVLLVIEIARTSLSYDRQIKAPLYARFGIPDYWIVDLNSEQIEVYREPSPTGYRSMHIYARGQSVSPLFAPDLVVEVDAILGPVEADDAGERPSADKVTPDD